MSTFEAAYPTIQKNEGGYANDPDDLGGETYAGISRKNFSGWQGWALIDAAKTLPDFPLCLKKVASLPQLVEYFYRVNFWCQGYEQIADQGIATWMLDRAVNCGSRTANKMLQNCVDTIVDGMIGKQTIKAVNAADPAELQIKLTEQAQEYYRNIVAKNPKQAKFLNGWLARC